MSKKKMLEAQRLIKAKDYTAARKILRTVDHPKAREWEARLDKVAPARTSGTARAASGGKMPVALLLGIGAVVVIIVAAAVLLLTSNNAAPGPQVAEEPTSEAALATDTPEPTADSAASPTDFPAPPPAGSDRPAQLPDNFPFPEGGFTQVFDLSDEDDISISVYTALSFDELDAFYRETLPAAGYEFVDFSAGDTIILSFLGNGTLGNVRVTNDGPDGEARVTVEMEATTATSLNDLETGSSQGVAEDIRFDSAEAAAAAFLSAMASGDSVTVLALICDANREFFDEESFMRTMLGAGVPGGELDMSRLQYTAVPLSPDVAEVEISGEMLLRVTVGEVENVIPIPIEDPIVIEFHQIDGWQLCSLPE